MRMGLQNGNGELGLHALPRQGKCRTKRYREGQEQRGIGKGNRDYQGYGTVSVLGKTKAKQSLYSLCDSRA